MGTGGDEWGTEGRKERGVRGREGRKEGITRDEGEGTETGREIGEREVEQGRKRVKEKSKGGKSTKE